MRTLNWIVLFGGALVCMPAYAYIDPGTGSALIQGLIAAIAALGVTLKLYWHRVARLFARRTNKDSKPAAEVGTEQASRRTPT
jgi:uncharacterized membrane protein